MSRLVVFGLALALFGCGPDAPPEPTPEPVPEVAPVPEPPPLLEPPVEVPSPTDAELDQMDEPALEAACFAGSTAACDRLGH